MPGLRQAVEVLRRQLRIFHVNTKVDFHGLLQGYSSSFVQLYRYILCDHSVEISSFLLDNNFLLGGTDDQKFMEILYRMCRDVLNMKPLLSLAQFFTNGFTEKKLLMVADLIKALAVLKTDIDSTGLSQVNTLRLSHSSSARPGAIRKLIHSESVNTSDEILSHSRLATENTQVQEKIPDKHVLKINPQVFLKPPLERSAFSMLTDNANIEMGNNKVSRSGDLYPPHVMETSVLKNDSEYRANRQAAAGECLSVTYSSEEDSSRQNTPRVSFLLNSITEQVQSLVNRLGLIESRVSKMENNCQSSKRIFLTDNLSPEITKELIQSNSAHTNSCSRSSGHQSITPISGMITLDSCSYTEKENHPQFKNPPDLHSAGKSENSEFIIPEHAYLAATSVSSRELESYPRVSMYSGGTFRPSVSVPCEISQTYHRASVMRQTFSEQPPADVFSTTMSHHQFDNNIQEAFDINKQSTSKLTAMETTGGEPYTVEKKSADPESVQTYEYVSPSSDRRKCTPSINDCISVSTRRSGQLSPTHIASFNCCSNEHTGLIFPEGIKEIHLGVNSTGKTFTRQVDRINSMLTETQRLLSKTCIDSEVRHTSKRSLVNS